MLGSDAAAVAPPRGRAGALAAATLLIITLAAAVSVDVVRTGYGVKSDEATYVAMALSLAFDHDLAYQRRDLERYVGLYRWGPDGIYLKRGKQLHVRLRSSWPFVHVTKTLDPRADRLYFGKAFVYSLAAAPFVRFFGLNGFLIFHVLLMFVVCVCGYTFLAARARPGPALLFTLAFVGASCVPVYMVFLAPEIFHFALVFVAYFLWLYKEVAPGDGGRGFLFGFGSDIGAAVLLGIATYSKPSHALLVAPLVLWWWRRRFWRGVGVGAAAVIAAALLFGANGAISGEFNYQGGDRRRFVSEFPFQDPKRDTWNDAKFSAILATNDSDAASVSKDFTYRFAHNVEYFLIGRHFGFVPYFFPGVVAIGLWLASRERRQAWRLLVFLGVAGSAVALLVIAPFTWSGGGGPPGNRYFMSVYAALFFVTPPMVSAVPALLAWVGGALFTAKMLVNPFVAAKFPNQTTERGFARRLPVELTMANDLPIMLEGPRAHSWFNDVLMYFLDQHAYNPEIVDKGGQWGVWIAGDGRADIIVRSEWPIDHLSITASSPIRTTFITSMGGRQAIVPLTPGKAVTFDLPAAGVRDLNSYAYLFSALSTEGVAPCLNDPASKDCRNLGVVITFRAVPVAQAK